MANLCSSPPDRSSMLRFLMPCKSGASTTHVVDTTIFHRNFSTGFYAFLLDVVNLPTVPVQQISRKDYLQNDPKLSSSMLKPAYSLTLYTLVVGQWSYTAATIITHNQSTEPFNPTYANHGKCTAHKNKHTTVQ